jgi:hypothetical protein
MYCRSRAWRTRGPSFGSRAGVRRRGQLAGNSIINGFTSTPFVYGVESDGDDGIAVTEGDEVHAAALPTPYVSAARIDERGLLALARGALEQTQIQAAEHLIPPQIARPDSGSLAHLLATGRSDLMIVSPSKRSA